MERWQPKRWLEQQIEVGPERVWLVRQMCQELWAGLYQLVCSGWQGCCLGRESRPVETQPEEFGWVGWRAWTALR